MNNSPAPSTTTTPLRLRAEGQLQAQAGKKRNAIAAPRSSADAQRLLHELQVHQIELEMQNEELRKARDEMEAGLEKYSDLYDFAPVGYLTLTQEGVIREANLAGASLLGIGRSALVTQRFGPFVFPADRSVFSAFLREVFEHKAREECEVRLEQQGKHTVHVRMRANLSLSGQTCQVAVTDITKHKLAEAATAQLAAIVNSSSDAIIGGDLNSIITSWNAGAEKLFGYSPAEMVGASILRLIPSERQHEEAQIMSRIRKGESVEHFETVRIAKDGRRLEMSVTISPVRYADGKIVGASKVARDITDQKLAAEKVRVSEVRYRRLFEAAHDGVLLLDPATRKITDANPFMTKLLGYPHSQLVGKELFEIGLLRDEAASQAMFRKLTRKHEVRYEDLPLVSRDGRHQEVEVVANLYQENDQSVIQCNIRNITERKRIEHALVASEARYRNLFDSIDEGFCVIDLIYDRNGRCIDYRFSEINPAFNRQIGRNDAFGKRIREIAPGLEKLWFEAYGKVAETGRAVRFSNEAKALKRWFDVYAFRVGGAGSRKVAVLFRDITARKRIELALVTARTQLADHAEQLENMVATRTAQLVATNRRLETSVKTIRKAQEEYRTLLLESRVMQEKLRQLTRQIISAQEEERKKISRELHDDVVQTLVGINVELSALVHNNSGGVRTMKDKIAHTQRLVEKSVDSVHRFARELRPTVLDDLGLIPALHAFCNGLAERKKLKIKMTAFGGVEALASDKRTTLFRVAQEALTNIARHARATQVVLNITKVPGAIRMEIGDNGQSFAVEKVLQAKNPKRLGLVGMKERIEMVGGSLTIESIPGRGTTVRADIPFSLPNPSKKLTKK